MSSDALEAYARLAELERDYAVAALASETAHDLATPVNFFDHLLQQLTLKRELSERELRVGVAQVARCRELLATLRQVRMPNLRIDQAEIRRVVEEATALTCVAPEHPQFTIDVVPTLAIRTDVAAFRLMLTSVLREASSTSPPEHQVRVSCRLNHDALHLEVTSVEPEHSAHSRLAAPSVPEHDRGIDGESSTRNAIARRLGWDLSEERDGALRVWRFSIPRREVIRE